MHFADDAAPNRSPNKIGSSPTVKIEKKRKRSDEDGEVMSDRRDGTDAQSTEDMEKDRLASDVADLFRRYPMVRLQDKVLGYVMGMKDKYDEVAEVKTLLDVQVSILEGDLRRKDKELRERIAEHQTEIGRRVRAETDRDTNSGLVKLYRTRLWASEATAAGAQEQLEEYKSRFGAL